MRVSGQGNARTVLRLSEGLAGELDHNVALWSAPAAPASSVYTGVLFEAAGASDWSAATLERAAARIRIISGLWGAISPADRISAYRLPMATTLGRIGGLAAFWAPRLKVPLDDLADGGLVVDCRSSSYIAAWRPHDCAWVSVRVMRELNGVRTVVSHMAKHTRGLLAAHVVGLDVVPKNAEDLADAASTLVRADLRDLSLTRGQKGPDILTLVIAGG